MLLKVSIYKERKEKDFRIVILPTGRAKNGLLQIKDYGIISYLNKDEKEKLGEFVLWAFSQSDEKTIESESEVKMEKKYFNVSSYRKITTTYNVIGFEYLNGKYSLQLDMKDGAGYSPFKDKDGKGYDIELDGKPTALELGTKIMEMFEFKEKYDGDY